MPLVTLPIPETHVPITRAVALAVINDLNVLMQLGIDTDKMPVQFIGRSTGAMHTNASLTRPALNKQSNMITTDSTDKVSISVNEEYHPDSILTTKTFGGNTSKRIWFDPNLSISMRPVYSTTKVTVNFTYRAVDIRAAEAWRDNIRLAIGRDRAEIPHEAEYVYPIPLEYIPMMHSLYSTRESQAGYGDTFKEWFNKHSSTKFTTVTTVAGKAPLLAIEEKQEMIIGYFDFTEPPKEERDTNLPTWLINFTYVYTYDKPIKMNLVYPLAIHNQLIPEHIRNSAIDTMYSRMLGHKSLTNEWMDVMRNMNHFYGGYLPGIVIPYFDEWHTNINPIASMPAVTILLGIEADDLTKVMSIRDFYYCVVDDIYTPYLTKYRNKILQYGFSPFKYQVFCGDKPMNMDNFYIDDQLVLRSHTPLNLRLTYHFRLCILTDLSLLSDEGIRAIGEFPGAAQDLIDFVYPGEQIKTIVDGKFVDGPSWHAIVIKYPPVTQLNRKVPYQLKRNVGHFFIQTTRT